MKDFKKRSLVLMLASVITVTGSFAAENYKNCLMDMELKSSGANGVNVILNTRRPYEGTISPVKRDANTFVIMLPEVDSSAPTPNLSDAGGTVESVEIKRMPYSNGGKGYTRITVKTNGYVNLTASHALYVPKAEEPKQIETAMPKAEDVMRERTQEHTPRQNYQRSTNEQYQSSHQRTSEARRRTGNYSSNPQRGNYIPSQTLVHRETTNTPDINKQIPEDFNMTAGNVQNEIKHENESQQKYLLGLMVLFIVMTSVYFYIKAQNKLNNVLGEKLDIDFKDEEEKKKSKKSSGKIQQTINKLDAVYSNNTALPMKEFKVVPTPAKQEDELNIVDLDALYNEQTTSEETGEENDALDDFLSGFSFDDTDATENIEQKEEEDFVGYDETVYETVLHTPELRFNKDDIECFNELLQSEISGEVMNNLDKYAVSNPIAPQKPSKDKLLADFVTDYAISQNISFSQEDISTLRKLISVEIDADFVTDLRTNPQRMAEMEKEILETKPVKKKPSEIITLKVKDILPNLSEELKLHGNKPVESNAKPETIYFSEGYEVSKLSLDFDLPDLAKELNNRSAYASKPSETVNVVDNTYATSIEKLTISGLPDLEDVLAHPEKYEKEPEEKFVADEKSLLNSIANVQFKPFYDSSRDIEIINEFDDEPTPEFTADISDIKNEFSQFENFEVAEDDAETESPTQNQNNYDDFETLYNNEFYDLDKIADISKQKEGVIPQNPNKVTKKLQIKPSSSSEELLKLLEETDKITPEKIEITKNKKEVKKQESTEVVEKAKSAEIKKENQKPKRHYDDKCVVEGIRYDIASSASINNTTGCHLGKAGEKYAVLAYKDSEIKIIKEYDSLKSEKIQIRVSETLPDGTPRYLVRIGLNKFVADLINGEFKYVMDLC